jgi:energy-coupling factor transporter ATP-binding protein EcfA2
MKASYQLFDRKIVIRLRNTICDTPSELLASPIFLDVLNHFIHSLTHQNSRLLRIFPNEHAIKSPQIRLLVETFTYLVNLPVKLVPQVLPGSEVFTRDPVLLNDFVEQLYNYWRTLHRLIVCDSTGDRFDKRPYRTFNDTVETLMHVVRSTYRDIQENISGDHPHIYRQVSAGAEIGAIARAINIPYPAAYKKLNNISVISQVLIYPPMIFNTPTNKRSGGFLKVASNPLENLELPSNEWLCYPAKVGNLLIMIYFSMPFFELGFSLCNLFELADEKDLRKPDAIFLFGTPPAGEKQPGATETIFFDDLENQIVIGTIPQRDQYGYFGYLKKMALTLHNIIMLKRGRLPYHGAMFHLALHGGQKTTFLVVGDTGAGKSETLEAMRGMIKDDVENLVIVADDMGSIEIAADGTITGYGTEMGAFVRLDDLQSGYAFGQIDRAILMNPDEVNARVILPVTKFDDVIKGYPVDFILYANNYETVDETHQVIQPFRTVDEALDVFRAGAVMSKGTTTSTGLVNSFYANIFGPPSYPELQEELSRKYFTQFFQQGLFVGQLRTQLGIPGMEHTGPEQAAQALLNAIRSRGR